MRWFSKEKQPEEIEEVPAVLIKRVEPDSYYALTTKRFELRSPIRWKESFTIIELNGNPYNCKTTPVKNLRLRVGEFKDLYEAMGKLLNLVEEPKNSS